MAISADEIRLTVEKYLAQYPDERDRLAPLVAALDGGASLASRTEFRGHVTCGAAVLDATGRVLHIQHNVLMRWLLPGGHLEPADVSLRGAALREVCEETGIAPEALSPLAGFETIPVDIDVHPIPANPAKGEPDHWHFDVRYAFELLGTPTVRLQDEEVSGVDWLTPDTIPELPLRLKLLSRAG